MGNIKSYKDLGVWKKAHQFVLDAYELSKNYPMEEKYNLRSQFIRASVSVPLNIVEGFGRYSKKEFINFLIIARSSSCEVEYILILSKDLNYFSQEDYEGYTERIIEIRKMINGLINSLRKITDSSQS